MMILKRIASVAFGIAFILAINIFAGIGREYIDARTARLLFLIFGAIALVANLLSFQSGKNGPVFNFLYWSGSIISFIGLIFHQFHWPYSMVIIITGMVILGISFVLPSSLNSLDNQKNDDILDDI